MREQQASPILLQLDLFPIFVILLANSMRKAKLSGWSIRLWPESRASALSNMARNRRAVAGPVTTAMLLGLALLGASCKTYSSRDVSGAAACAMRLERGSSVEAEAAQLAQPLIDSGHAYGMAVGVLTPDGRTQSFGFGRTGLPGDASPPRADTIFEVGSVSKLCVTMLLAALVKEGRMSYQDTVRDILPADVPVSPAVGELTLYELVTHTGGFPRQPNNAIQGRYFISYLFTGKDLYGYITKPYLYEYLRTCRLPPKAPRHYIYSNIGLALLAHLLEIKTGQTLPVLIEEKICGPLNMRDTGFVLSAEQKSRLAVGHVGDQPKFMRRGAPMAAWDMGEIMQAAGGLYSTVNDLLTFSRANLGFLDHPLAPILASTHRAQLKTSAQDVALGWLINYYDDRRLAVLHLHGMVSGYMAYIGLDVEDRVAVVVLCNTFNWDDKVGENLILGLARALRSGSNATQ
jgi:CubicO group peptidase (beta-lactamase class C family)